MAKGDGAYRSALRPPGSSLEHWDAAHGLTINSRPPRGRVRVLTGCIGRCRPTDVDRELSFLILKLDGAGWMAPEVLAARNVLRSQR
jgi:hypothetical protein